ncbi:MAG: ATP-binding protein [Acidobacteria bacterium]|nr:ATP-binding protein [Acidobacteriota bacterium]
MKIAVASGKGGTGKTTVAVNLALSLPSPVQLLDCDVEEPNCHLFLKPEIQREEVVGIPVPEVDPDLCDLCGECGRICQFNAIVSLKTQPLVFPELCHGCGGCRLVCPREAIHEENRPIGDIIFGRREGVDFVQGRLHIGQAMSPPLIRAVKKEAAGGVCIIDCPPGTTCPVITAIRDTDFVVLVTEPTPFGLHDLRLAVDTCRALDLPFGVVINRCDSGDERVVAYCHEEHIPVLLEIADDRRIAEAYSRGEPAVEALPRLRRDFSRLWKKIQHHSTRMKSTVTRG